jgi:hypothetical protein
MSPFNEKSYFFGTNIPGKARSFLLNSLGRPKLLEMMEAAAKTDYAGFFAALDWSARYMSHLYGKESSR